MSIGTIIAHWHHSVEGFQGSPLEIYTQITEVIRVRELPETTVYRVEHSEAGILSGKREYLRVERGPLHFDICAAPFSTGFFFSSWLVRIEGKWLPGCLLGLFLLAFPPIIFLKFGFGKSLFPSAILVLGALAAFAFAARRRFLSVGTYFQIDSALMFQAVVHAAVVEVIQHRLAQNGLRALSEAEQKPVLKDFATIGKAGASER